MANKLRLTVVADALLLKLYELAQDGYSWIDLDKMPEAFANNLQVPVITLAAETLEELELIHLDNMNDRLKINKKGFQKVEAEIDTAGSFFAIYEQEGDEWLLKTGGKIEPPVTQEAAEFPTAENNWEPLPIDRADPATEKVIDQLENAMIAVKQDNGYSENYPEERDYVVQNLSLAVEWMRIEKAILGLKTKAWVLDPLDQAAKRFGPSVVGAAITMARELFVAWLKKKLIGG